MGITSAGTRGTAIGIHAPLAIMPPLNLLNLKICLGAH